jgi:hypothetical protein
VGWIDTEDGLEGDAPADEMADGVNAAIVALAASDVSVSALLHGLLDALRCDGKHDPFTTSSKRVSSIRISAGAFVIEATPGKANAGCAASLFDALDGVAASYRDAELEAPSLRMALRYFAHAVSHHARRDPFELDLEPSLTGFPAEQLFDAIVRAELRFDGPKPRDRQPRPIVQPSPPSQRVRHAKFGVGLLIEKRGDQVVVEFPSGRRTLLARVIEPI